MSERISITFELNEEDIIAFMSNEGSINISSAFDTFLKNQFSNFLEIHINNIKHNFYILKLCKNHEEIETMALEYLKAIISKEDMLKLQAAIVKVFFEECLAKRKPQEYAIKQCFKSQDVISIANAICNKLIATLILENK